jgi:HAD superfamily hydrolase (TIGR01509 family)
MTDARAVLFDLDGVLVDSHDAWFAVVKDVAKGFGAPPVDAARFEKVWGQGIAADVANLYPGTTFAQVEAAYEEAFPRHAEAIRVNPESAPVLDDLRSSGVPTACVTNTQASLGKAILRAAGLFDLFTAVRGMEEGIREKPAPDLLLAALEAVGVRASEALMVGDTRYDEEAARAAGTAFVRYDFRSGASLARALRARVRAR